MKTRQLLLFFVLLAAGIGTSMKAQTAVTVGAQVTAENQIISGKAYVLKTGADRYITDNGTNYDVPNSANSATEASVYYLISNGDGTWKIKNYYTKKYWGVPVYNSALTSVAEASAGAWSLNFSSSIAYPSAPDANSTVRGIDRSDGKVWGWSTGNNDNHKVYIYEVSLLTSPVNIRSGWYQIKWVDINSDTNTDYTNADVEDKYVRNYSEEVTVNDVKYPLYLANAPSSIDENAASLVYFEYLGGESGRGVEGYLRSTSGHYITPSGSASSTKAGKNYIIYRSSGTPNISVITSAYTNSGGARHSFVPRGKEATPYIGLTADEIFPAVNMYAVNPAYLGLQAWTVNVSGTEEDIQVTYTGSAASGLTSVYNGGTFFLTTGVTPTANQFTATNSIINVNSEEHTINVSYISETSVFTIRHASRGALIYNPDASTKYVWSSEKSGTFNASNANSQWVIYPTNTSGQYYLYNVGADKFAIPSGTASEASWVFSSDAVAVTFITQSDGTKKIKTATTNTYAAVSNGFDGPIINYNDEGGNFTITMVSGDESTAVTAAVNKLADNVTPLSAIPEAGTSDWYIIRIKTHGTYADKYVYPAASEINYNGTYYPLTFDHGANVRPAIDDATYYTRIIREGGTVYWQLPNGKYLYGSGNKFPISTFDKSSFSMDYASGIRMWGSSRYAVPYYLGSQYFVGETSSPGNAYYDLYPINLSDAGLVAWKVIQTELDASTKVTCTRSDVKGLTSVYNNGYFFLPSGSTPANGEFTAEVNGTTITVPVTIDSEEHTITTSLPVLTINSPMTEATFTWNGESQTGKSVTFVYTGEEVTDETIYVSEVNEYTSPSLSSTTWNGTSSTTVTCTWTPAFFSENYGDKWVRIASARNTNVVMGISSGTSGELLKQKTLDYFDDGQLWCLVGNTTSFKMYNKKSGNTLQLASANTTISNGVAVNIAAVDAAGTSWQLTNAFNLASNPGWNISYEGSSGFSLNVWAGASAGNDVKYYQTPDVGDQWLIADASGEVTLALAGLTPSTMTVYTQNIANLPTTIVGNSSQTLLTKDNFKTRTAYVPNGSELTFGTPALFQNYGFTGYDGSNQTKTVTATTTPQTVTATFSVVRSGARYLWEPLRIYNGSGEKDFYRIPAIVTAKNGDIIAINDRRWNNDTDLGNNSGTAANPVNHHIDIIGVASSDNGDTWGSEFMIMDGTGSGALAGYGDAATVADCESNKVLVMACAGNVFYTGQNNSYHQTIQRTVLTHNGTTWVAETPTDVTNQFFAGSLASSNGMFIGSGVIAQSKIIKKGDYYRIYCAVLERSNSNFVFYSDDFGLTWTMMGTTAPANDNEPKVEELPDGSVLLSVRKGNGRTFNVWTWDDETYTTGSWGTAVASNNQTGGISFGNNSTNGDIRLVSAIKKSTGEMVTLAMQSVPTANSRAEVSLYYKELDPSVTYTPTTIAQNWSSRFLVTPHSSAYSSFTQQPDGRIGLYMEEAPKSVTGYYMCYVPLTLDEITNNVYTGVASTYNVTLNAVGSANYATLYLPFDVTTDANTKAYYISSVSGNYAKLTEVDNSEIAAKTAVVLINESSNSATFNVTSGLTQQVDKDDNLLKGTLVSMSLDLSDETSYYSLGKKNNIIGFYKFDKNGTTSITLGANKAYLDTSASANSIKGFIFDFDDDPDAIVSPFGETEEGAAVYNLAGQMVNGKSVNGKLPKGIYIVNGKKVLK